MLKTTLALAAALFALPALADTHISYVDDGGQPGTQIYVKGGKVRIESGHNISIYDLATNSMTVLMPCRNAVPAAARRAGPPDRRRLATCTAWVMEARAVAASRAGRAARAGRRSRA